MINGNYSCPPRKAIVVGAGFGGLAMSLRLRRLGYEVSVVDNNPKAGGRAQVYEIGEYKFDGGPTVITAPFLFDELFELYGNCLLYTSPSPRDLSTSRMPSSA